jgi:hypothetical protein
MILFISNADPRFIADSPIAHFLFLHLPGTTQRYSPFQLAHVHMIIFAYRDLFFRFSLSLLLLKRIESRGNGETASREKERRGPAFLH